MGSKTLGAGLNSSLVGWVVRSSWTGLHVVGFMLKLHLYNTYAEHRCRFSTDPTVPTGPHHPAPTDPA
jgi:hypothetical protein